MEFKERLAELKSMMQEQCLRPLIIFDDDPDGLCSFLLMRSLFSDYHYRVAKAKPFLDKAIGLQIRQHMLHEPFDSIIILDVPVVEPEFIDLFKSKKIFWFDHHDVSDLQAANVQYCNPKQFGDEVPTAQMISELVGDATLHWLGQLGTLADWHIPKDIAQFLSQFNFSEEYQKENLLVGDYLFHSDPNKDTSIGRLVKILSFALKGRTSIVHQNIRYLLKATSPLDLLDDKKFLPLMQHYQMMNKQYQQMVLSGLASEDEDMLLYYYDTYKISLTKEVANELCFRSKKLVIVARASSGYYRCSIRSPPAFTVKPFVLAALEGLDGYGGGHDHACGASVRVEEFSGFVERIRSALKDHQNV